MNLHALSAALRLGPKVCGGNCVVSHQGEANQRGGIESSGGVCRVMTRQGILSSIKVRELFMPYKDTALAESNLDE